jgi:hypothetical protein
MEQFQKIVAETPATSLGKRTRSSSSSSSCEYCRSRHTSCKGRPICENCFIRGLECIFSTPRQRGPKPKEDVFYSKISEHIPKTFLGTMVFSESCQQPATSPFSASTSSDPSSSSFSFTSSFSLGSSFSSSSSSSSFTSSSTSSSTPTSSTSSCGDLSPSSPSILLELETFLHSTSPISPSRSPCPLLLKVDSADSLTSLPSSSSLSLYLATSPSDFSASSSSLSSYQQYIDSYANIQPHDWYLLDPSKVALVGDPTLLPLNTVEGRLKRSIILSVFAMGANRLSQSSMTTSFYLEALQLIDEHRSWRTRYILKDNSSAASPSTNDTDRRGGFAEGGEERTVERFTLEEELRQLKQDKLLTRALQHLYVAFLTTNRRASQSHQHHGVLIPGSLLECSSWLIKKWIRLSRKHPSYLLIPNSVKRLALVSTIFNHRFFHYQDRVQWQELLLTSLNTIPTTFIPSSTSSSSSTTLISVLAPELARWTLASVLLEDMLDIFTRLPRPQTISSSSSFVSSSPFSPLLQLCEQEPHTNSSFVSSSCSGSLSEDRERFLRLHRLVVELQELVSLLQLQRTTPSKLHSWTGCVTAFQVTRNFLLFYSYSFFSSHLRKTIRASYCG